MNALPKDAASGPVTVFVSENQTGRRDQERSARAIADNTVAGTTARPR